MEYDTLLIERKGKSALVTINRPEVMNALNGEVVSDLTGAVEEFSKDETLSVVIITGAGERAFIAGADIKHMSTLTPQEVFEFILRAHHLTSMIEKSPKVVIAMVNGYALGGGCELAMSCDLIVASEKAIFGQPEVKLGIIPGMGGTQRLSRIAGRNIAKEIVLTGDPIDARRAYEIGLANRVVPREKLLEETLAIADKIASNGPFALASGKRVINEGIDLPLEGACFLELNAFSLGFSTEDRDEGMKAFLEKRKARFRGK